MKQVIGFFRGKWYKATIRIKLICIFMFICSIIFMINIFMYLNINATIDKINQVYISNVKLNELSSALSNVQNNMTEYLTTKSSQSLQDYYSSQQEFNEILNTLNTTITDSNILLMEKNIKNMSKTYLEITKETMQAKRGRNVEKYKNHYDKASDLYSYINTYINSLNNEQFRHNSENYKSLLISLGYLEKSATIVLGAVMIVSICMVYMLTYSVTDPLIDLAKSADEIAKET